MFLLLADVTAHIVSFLHASSLLKLSMVSKQAKNTVDSVSANFFSMTSSYSLRDWVGLHPLLVMKLDAARQQLYHTYTLEHPLEVYNMLLHAQMQVGRLLPIEVELEVPLDCARTGASQAPVSSGRWKSSLRVCVTVWKVVDIAPDNKVLTHHTQGHQVLKHNRPWSIAATHLKAVSYRVLERLPPNTACIPFAMMLRICNTPIDNSLSARERAVVNSCVMCMNCHQRKRAVRSMDVTEKRHRVGPREGFCACEECRARESLERLENSSSVL